MAFDKGCTPWNKGLKYNQEFKKRLNLEGLKLGRIQRIKYKSCIDCGKTSKWIKKLDRCHKCWVKTWKDRGLRWKGGISRAYKTGYYSREYKQWRLQVFKRDRYTCQQCGTTGKKTYLTAHHIKSFAHYPTLRFELGNGQTLCEECHKLTDNYKGRNKRRLKVWHTYQIQAQ